MTGMTHKPMKLLVLMIIAAFAPAALAASAAQVVPVPVLKAAPAVDGDLGEWGEWGWQTVTINPAVEGDDQNRTGTLDVQLRLGVHGDRVYVAARWADDKEDLEYKPWEWSRNRYRRGKDRDDMFAIRFEMNGDYNRCMIAEVDYGVDVWLWSAGRSNRSGYAMDMWHSIGTGFVDGAAEYKGPTGKTVYIRKGSDDGEPIYVNTRPDMRTHQGDVLPGIELTPSPSGSVADVAAKGVWRDGFWHLEMSRKLDTGYADDAVLRPGGTVNGAIAVFDRAFAEHKSVSGTLTFEFAAKP